ncbi:hypothetical protein [Parasphingorhabdus pacifica]
MSTPDGGPPGPQQPGSEYIADYEEQALQENQQQYSGLQHSMPLGTGAPLAHAMSAMKTDQQTTAYGQQQATQLSAEQELRERPGALGSTHYLSFEHKQLASFVRDNFDTGTVHEVGRLYHDHGSKLIEFSDRIRTAAQKTEQNWTGDAGNAMRAHVTQVAEHMGHSGGAARLTANQVGMQAESGERAKNAMPEVIEFDLKNELVNYASDPNPFTAVSRANDIVEKHEQSQQAHQQAAEVVTTMEGDFGEAAAKTPAFVPAPPEPGDQGDATPKQANPPASSFQTPTTPAGTSSSWAGGGGVGSGVGSGVGGGTGGATGGGNYTLPANSSPPAAGTGSAWAPGGDGGQNGYRQNPQTGQWERRNPYNGRWAPMPPGQVPPGAGVGAAGAMGGAGGGARGVRAPAAGGPGGQLGAGGRAGAGPVPGAGAGAGAGTGAGGAGGSGGRGAMGGAGGGARGGQGGGEDEDEHQTKYVLEGDEAWDDLGLPKVAPPVFGE